MVKELPSAQLSDSQAPPSYSFINELLTLTERRDLDELLRQGLNLAIRGLEAESGSLLFQLQTPQIIRSGLSQPEALARIERWEEVIQQRLAGTTWNMPASDSLPISTSHVADNQLMLVNIPLSQNNIVVGSLSLVLSPHKSLTAEARQRLNLMARGIGQVAGIVAELQHASHRLKQMGVFYQVGQALVTTFDINRLLADTMQLASNVIDAGASSIMLIDEARQELVFEVSHGSNAHMLRQQRIPLDEGIGGWVARHGHPVIANNARTDPRFSQRVDVRTGFLTQSIAAVPLRVKGRIIGVLEVLNKYSDTGFDQEDVRLMNAIAAQAAIAIENARLYQEVRQERDQLVRAEENVRQDLAQNLHRGPMQQLSALNARLDQLERLSQVQPEAMQREIEAVRKLVQQANRDTRTILFEFHPLILETQGLVAALDHSVTQLQNSESFTVHFEPVEHMELNRQVARVIFAIVQEAINNVTHHADAKNVWLTVEQDLRRLMIGVHDDGCGFAVERHNPDSSSGLRLMREQAELIEADLRIDSRPEPPKQGTTIQLILPMLSDDVTENNTST